MSRCILVTMACCVGLPSIGAFAVDQGKQTGLGVVFVDQSDGVDSESRSGEASEPFASITFAIQVLELLEAHQPWTINVEAGTYSATAENPETFPIRLHTGMVLRGVDGAEDTIISGLENSNVDDALVFGDGATGVTISGITFRDQARTGGTQRGGALELLEFGGTITDCIFANNSCVPDGGAIYMALREGETCDLLKTTFDSNQAVSSLRKNHHGGAVHVGSDFSGSVSNCDFLNNIVNTTTGYDDLHAYGAGFFVDGNMVASTFRENLFSGNLALAYQDFAFGGALCVTGNIEATIEACEFLDGMADDAKGYGGAVYVGGALVGGVKSTTFDGNSAGWQGGAIFVGESLSGVVSSSNFKNNSGGQSGGGLYVGTTGAFSLASCTFENNRTESALRDHHQGGGIYVGSDFRGEVTDCIFSDNFVNASTGYDDIYAHGAGMYVGGNFSSSLFQGNEFSNNVALAYQDVAYGGALSILGNAEVNINSCEFLTNKANDSKGYGGALYVGGALSGGILETTFQGSATGWQGGAVYIGGALSGRIALSSISDSVAGSRGGGMYITEASALTIENSTFSNNRIESSERISHQGGGVYIGSDFGGNLTNSTFSGNYVNASSGYDNLDAHGGGLFVAGNLASTKFEGNRFEGNRVFAYQDVAYGGGLCVLGNFSASISSCVFSANIVDDSKGDGGGIYVGGTFTGDITDSQFQDNFAATAGGALHFPFTWTGSLRNSSFLRNRITTNSARFHTQDDVSYAPGAAVCVIGDFGGEVTGNLFSDNAIERDDNVISAGGSMMFFGAFDALVVDNDFTNNQTANTSGSIGGAIAVLGQVSGTTQFYSNTFSGNYSQLGGALYFAFEGNLPPDIYNNHFLHNRTDDDLTGGTAIYSYQNVNVYNNTLWGGGNDMAAIRLRDTATGSLIQNNIFAEIGAALNIRGENSVRITHNTFFNTENILILNEEALGSVPSTISTTLGNSSFLSNSASDPRIIGEGDEAQNMDRFSGRWDQDAYYDAENDWTVFTEQQGTWAHGEVAGMFVNLSQDEAFRHQYEIIGNTDTLVYVAGNLAPIYEGTVAVNRGLLGEYFTIDNYRLSALSPSMDAGDTVITDRDEDKTPLADYEGDARPMNCNVDMGADESARPVLFTISLVGSVELCLPLGGLYVEEGAIGLDGDAQSISELITIGGTVDTAVSGTYILEYSLGFCLDNTVTVTRTVHVGGGCDESFPTANAGPDQIVAAGTDNTATVVLDGSMSSDPDGSIASYVWSEVGGSNDPEDVVTPSITLPVGLYTFDLTVTDDEGNTDSDQVAITVMAVTGIAPVANAGVDHSLTADASGTVEVSLDGSASSDSDGTISTFAWIGLNGAPDPDDAVSPTLTLGVGQYEFQLTVTDNDGNTSLDTVIIVVASGDSNAPVADAGSDVTQSIDAATRQASVTLDGSGSSDNDGTISSYTWIGLNGAPDPDDTVSPSVSLQPGTYSFQLTVTDNDGLTAVDVVEVNVPRPSLDDLRSMLSNAFNTADTNSDGVLSSSEAQAYIPFLTAAEFSSMDTGGDGALTSAELNESDTPPVMGCAAGTPAGGESTFSDLIVILLALGLLGIGHFRKGAVGVVFKSRAN